MKYEIKASSRKKAFEEKFKVSLKFSSILHLRELIHTGDFHFVIWLTMIDRQKGVALEEAFQQEKEKNQEQDRQLQALCSGG